MTNSVKNLKSCSERLAKCPIHPYPRFYAFRGRGILYLSKKLYKNAIDDLTSAIEITYKKDLFIYWPGIKTKLFKLRSRVYFLRGFAYIKKQNLDKGIEDLTKSIELYPKIINENKSKFKMLPPEIRGLLKFFDI